MGKRLPDKSSENNGTTAQVEKGISTKETPPKNDCESAAIHPSSTDAEPVTTEDEQSLSSQNAATISEVMSFSPKALNSKLNQVDSRSSNTNTETPNESATNLNPPEIAEMLHQPFSTISKTEPESASSEPTTKSNRLHSNRPVEMRPPVEMTAAYLVSTHSTETGQKDSANKPMSNRIFHRLRSLFNAFTRTEVNVTSTTTSKTIVDFPTSLKPMETLSTTPSTPQEIPSNFLSNLHSKVSSSALSAGESFQPTSTPNIQPSSIIPPFSISSTMETTFSTVKPTVSQSCSAVSEPQNQGPLDAPQNSIASKLLRTFISPVDYLTLQPKSSRHLTEPVARNQSLHDISLFQPPLINFNAETVASYQELKKTLVRFPTPSSPSPEALMEHYTKQIDTHKPPEISQNDIERIWQSWLGHMTPSGQGLDEAVIRRAAQMTLGVAAKISRLRKEAKERDDEVDAWMKERERNVIMGKLETKGTWYPLTETKTGVDQNDSKPSTPFSAAQEGSQTPDKLAYESTSLSAEITTNEQVSSPRFSDADLEIFTSPDVVVENPQSVDKAPGPPKAVVKGLPATP